MKTPLTLWLLTTEEVNAPTPAAHIELDGRRWSLVSERLSASSTAATQPADPPPYICVSYTWGPGRVPSPLPTPGEGSAVPSAASPHASKPRPPRMISDRTLPALVAAARVVSRLAPPSAAPPPPPPPMRIWLDALCVPEDSASASEPDSESGAAGGGGESWGQKARTLASMGAIYGGAASVVVVVLPGGARAALARVGRGMPLRWGEQQEDLDGLEAAMGWVARAWTYQEAVNSTRLYFTAEAEEGEAGGDEDGEVVAVDMMQLFSSLGQSLQQLKKEQQGPQQPLKYPLLDALEDLLGDCATGGYLERSALQVMTAMSARSQTVPDDHFYAMTGAVSTEVAELGGNRDAFETFVELCERKGDYSFVFSAVPRAVDSDGRRWRPARCRRLEPVLRRHSWTGQQLGRVSDDGHLVLENMVVLEPGREPDADAMIFVARWLKTFRPGASDECETLAALGETVYLTLRSQGFIGIPQCVTTILGLFFPFSSYHSGEEDTVFFPKELCRALSAPALLRTRGSGQTGGVFSYIPGVFIGNTAGRDSVALVDISA